MKSEKIGATQGNTDYYTQIDNRWVTEQDEISKTYSFPKSYVSYCKPKRINIEQRELARQMMIAKNKAKEDGAKVNGILYALVVR